MTRPRASFLLRRMGASRILLGSMLLSILVTAALAAALATFSAQALPRAARRELVAAPNLTVTISGQVSAQQSAADTGMIRSSLRTAFGPVPVRLSHGLWSDPLGLPSVSSGQTIALTKAAALDQVNANAVLVSGSWPKPSPAGQPVQAALPATVVSRLGLRVGQLLVLPDRDTGQRVRIVLTGQFRPRDPASSYWGLDLISSSGISVSGNFVSYGPLIVAPATFGPGGLTVGTASWLAQPALARISPASLSGLGGRVSRLLTSLAQSSSLGGLTAASPIPRVAGGIASNLQVARSLLLISVLQLLLLAAVAITLTARMLASEREEESALLSARGVTRWQLARLTLTETVLLATAAAVAGTLAGAWLAGPLARIGPLHGIGLQVSGWPTGIWWTAGAILAISAFVMLLPAIRPARPGAVRIRRGRQAKLAGAVQAGADLAIIAIGALAAWQLRDYSAVSRGAGGQLGVDPVLVAAPTLALAGAALIPLRLLPAIAAAADRLAARTRRLAGALASWQVSRRPIRQSGPVLLVILAAAAGTLALAQHATWQRSAEDQADFAVGADVRVSLAAPVPLGQTQAIRHARGVRGAMPVASFDDGLGGQVLAVDARQAAATVLMRADQSPLPATALWQKITPARPGPGLTLPGRPARLELTASLRSLSGGPPLRPVSVTFSVQDGSGIVYLVSAGRLPADGRSHDLIALLSATSQASYPLRVLGLTLNYQLPAIPAVAPKNSPAAAAIRAARKRRAALTFGGLAVSPAPAGTFPAPFTSASALRAWRPLGGSADLANPLAQGTSPVITGWSPAPGGSQTLSFGPGDGYLIQKPGLPALPVSGSLTLTAGSPSTPPIPAIASRAFLRAANESVGKTTLLAAGPASIPAKIVAEVASFPAESSGGVLIVDQAALQEALAGQSVPPLPVSQWWLRAAPGAAGHPAARWPTGSTVVYRARILAALVDNPLSAAPQQAVLAIALAAALLAALGFSVSVAASVRERRTQSAVLSALGVSRAAQARQLCLEELLLSGPAAIAGLLLGAGIAHLLVPTVTLTANATTPVPVPLIELPLGWAAGLAALITAIPVLVAAATIARRTDPAARLRAAEAV